MGRFDRFRRLERRRPAREPGAEPPRESLDRFREELPPRAPEPDAPPPPMPPMPAFEFPMPRRRRTGTPLGQLFRAIQSLEPPVLRHAVNLALAIGLPTALYYAYQAFGHQVFAVVALLLGLNFWN